MPVSSQTMSASSQSSEGSTSFIILISCIATIGGFLFGFDSGVINGTVDGLRTAFGSDEMGTGFNVASMLLGCAIGAFFAGRLADYYGRRTMLIIAALFFVLSAWGSGAAGSSGEFIVYRILGGLAVGAASIMAPAYISEVSLAHFRGRMATVQQIAIITGLFTAFLSNYFLAGLAGKSTEVLWLDFEAWRWMFWMELIPATIFLLALLGIPESPRFLVVKDRKGTALAVLSKLYGAVTGQAKMDEIYDSIAHDHKPGFRDLLTEAGKVRKIVWVGIGLATFQQLVGINVVFYYGAVLWQSVGFTESDALAINVLSGAISIAACIAAILLIDKIGRKPLLTIGSIGMAITLGLAAIAFSTATIVDGKPSLSDGMGVLALVAANAYVVFFNLSWGPVMWVMLGEMFPNQIRGSGLAIAGLFQWGSNFGITMTFPIMLGSIGLAGAYGFYTLCAAISIVFVIKYVHETNGIELEDMQG